jgi:hypothetical protein
MKKNVAAAVLLLLTSVLGAQSYEATRFYLGGHVAGSFPWIINQNNYGLPELRYKPTPGFSGGLVAGMSFTSQHQIQLEVSYALLGQSYQDNIFGGSIPIRKDIDLSYVQLPLMYRFGMKRSKDAMFYTDVTTFFFTAGIQPGFLVGQGIDWRVDDQAKTWEEVYDQFSDPGYGYSSILQAPSTTVSEQFKQFDLGAAGGFGVQRFFDERLLVSLELRTYFGLLDINGDDWKVPNRSGNYGASRNFSAGLRLNASYIF